jgi:hypothetical protein
MQVVLGFISIKTADSSNFVEGSKRIGSGENRDCLQKSG